MGCARDIVEHVGVPRYFWSDFPLGHSAGKPFNADSQQATLQGALKLFDHATKGATTVASQQIWSDDPGWKADFWRLDNLDAAKLAQLKADHERVRQVSAGIKQDT